MAVEFAPHFSYDLEDDAFFSQVLYSKIASPVEITPNFKSTGVVQTTFMSAGARTKNFEKYDFRWRAGLLNMDITRSPFSFGVTLLDANHTERLEADIRWANFRIGPSIYLGDTRNHITARIVGSAGLTTTKFGEFSYSGLSTNAGLTLRKRSYEFGYAGELFMFFFDKLAISGSFRHRTMTGGINPKIYVLNGILGVRINEFVTIRGSYTLEAIKSGPSSLEKSFIGFGFGLLL